ncbi:hypothetical protein QYE76_066115 [Lolium multiflorum]|uniref:RNase H type-1 domain-containing protein n=1 Tax=Lolium multiflorum TaxID=4521 RepID=A0AAD8SAF9_LOLMU|nr:hypothetical protein QYE76_066115 [Lolium multiflorum]
MAEYEALLHGLRIAKEIGIKHIICCGDSDLVAQQVAGTWNARNSVMAAYRDEVDEIAKCFLGYEVKYVGRDDNTAADMLSKLGSPESNLALKNRCAAQPELGLMSWTLFVEFTNYPNRSTGFTPFFLVYGSEAVLPTDIIHDSPRVSAYNEEAADEARQLSVDLIEEARNLTNAPPFTSRSSALS